MSGSPSSALGSPLPDIRPHHDVRQLASVGIHRYASKRLQLYTDIAPEIAKTLPPIIDQAYTAWEDYFGPLPPNPEGTDYQFTGYIIADKALFERVGLLPDDLPEFLHGRHRGAEFWMYDQKTDYYRRHLMIHEATHCFMTATREKPDLPPGWYMEGMAELFGTHRMVERPGSRVQGGALSARPSTLNPGPFTVRFRVMPDSKDDFIGFGRITLVRQDIAAGRGRTLDAMFRLNADDFLETESYAWSWALCKFLDTHPRYRDRFRRLGRCATGTEFVDMFRRHFEPDFAELRTEWQLFAAHLDYGYDIERAAIAFQPGKPLDEFTRAEPLTPPPSPSGRGAGGEGPVAVVDVLANRGWQSSGALLEQGKEYEVTASGQFTLANEPKPWISEPQGISFLYYDGKPLGQLLGTIRRAEPFKDTGRTGMLDVLSVGRQRRFTAPYTGTLYLRVNDFFSRLADNQGTVHVQVHEVR